MNQQPEFQFDDPGLKAAVQRAVGQEKAPAHLRQRIAAALAEEAAVEKAQPRRSRIHWDRRTLRTALAACIALVAIGYMALVVRDNFFPARPPVTVGPTVSELPRNVAQAMIVVHDRNTALTDYKLVPGRDLEKIREQLSQDVKIPVAVVELGDGWTFKSAAECKVAEVPAAEIEYSKQGQILSVFSIPAEAIYSAPNGAEYEQVVDGHALSGFRNGPGLYCLVGSAGADAPTLKAIKPLKETLQGTMPRSCGSGHGEVARASRSLTAG